MLQNLMFHVVSVQRPTPTKGTSGGEIDSYTTVYSELACCVQPVSTSWLVRYAQRGIDVTHTIFTNQGPTIRNGDRVVYGTRTFLVQGFRDLIELTRVQVIDCKELM